MKKKQLDILVVEDDEDLNKAYQIIIASEGHNVKAALNGEKALKIIQEDGDPNIIFLDLRMPVMDGIEFLQQYHPEQHPDTTIVVFSNYDAQNEVDEAYELGAHRYVLKARAAPKELLRIIADIAHEKQHQLDAN